MAWSCVCVCVCARVHVCVMCVCVRVRVRACVCVCTLFVLRPQHSQKPVLADFLGQLRGTARYIVRPQIKVQLQSVPTVP